jgi:hypothetical protein
VKGNNLILPQAAASTNPSSEVTGQSKQAAAPSVVSPYGRSYQHNGAAARLTAAQATRSGLRIGDVAIEEFGLQIPDELEGEDRRRLLAELQQEIGSAEAYPPILPPTKIPDLPPKDHVEEYWDSMPDMTEAENKLLMDRNNMIGAANKKLDKERTNLAAKKSRETRIEQLEETRLLLNDREAEVYFLRMRLRIAGVPAKEWEDISARTKQRVVAVIEGRVAAHEQQVSEVKKKELSIARAEREKQKAELKKDRGRIPDMKKPLVTPATVKAAADIEDGQGAAADVIVVEMPDDDIDPDLIHDDEEFDEQDVSEDDGVEAQIQAEATAADASRTTTIPARDAEEPAEAEQGTPSDVSVAAHMAQLDPRLHHTSVSHADYPSFIPHMASMSSMPPASAAFTNPDQGYHAGVNGFSVMPNQYVNGPTGRGGLTHPHTFVHPQQHHHNLRSAQFAMMNNMAQLYHNQAFSMGGMGSYPHGAVQHGHMGLEDEDESFGENE